ncbi:Nucleolar complex protein 4 [Wickerhamomyces ciferrii]|uniref:Nucleolar complex protein 4 n=1 Tax=Wickerhamomyces ciferrii (strain ATCC 14091 / BCRC 22168 / CBS 111 / JCM 3599 / NBRC 0793 / NRRL Y-1031 F-60-10) TaxID=1206466 RepID=K0KIW1_WICCF|nr:Nucleolar complex protein 4 [Wickerhamomyces ciferrii]CCH41369.1 Nucleolar complex protein 4 [Wickerhamomyces ciferrii]
MGKRSSITGESPAGNKKKVSKNAGSGPKLSKEYITKTCQTILENINELNFPKLNELINLYDPLLENLNTEEKLNQNEPIARLLNIQLLKIFEKLFELELFNPSKVDISDFKKLKHVYEMFKFNLLFLLENISFDCSLIVDNLDIYLKLIKLESIHFATSSKSSNNDKNPFFPTKTYKNLIISILKSQNGEILGDGTTSNIIVHEFIDQYYKKYQDLQFYFVNELPIEEFSNESANNESIFSKFLTIMKEKNLLLESLEEPKTFVSNLPSIVNNQVHYKSSFENKWLHFLNSELNNNQYKTVLLILHKRIIPFFARPTKLMDFLTDSYEMGGIVAILSLNGLFELIKKYNLDYPNFYTKLYSLFDQNLFHVKYRSRFLRLTDIFLSSTHLPSQLVASFIKKMARLSITSSPSAVVSIIPFIYNLLKKHPTCMILLQNTSVSDDYTDPYNDKELDPLQTKAIESSLWELETLQSHYHPNVATLAKIFSQPFRKQSYNMEDFLDWSYASLLQSENTRRLKTEVALEYENFDTLLGGYVQGWTW